MEQREITIGQTTFELSRVYSGKQTLQELIQTQIEQVSAAFDRVGTDAV